MSSSDLLIGLSSPELLRLTVAALMRHTGETQTDLAEGIGLSQAQVSRKQSGKSEWSIADLDRLSRHYTLWVPELLSGPTEAVRRLPRSRLAATVGGHQSVIPAWADRDSA